MGAKQSNIIRSNKCATLECVASALGYMWKTERKNLTVLFQQDSVPSVVNLIGSKADLNSTTLAQRLGKNNLSLHPGGGGVLPYISYIGMCRCKG